MSFFWRRICSRITRALKQHGTWKSYSFLTCWGCWRALVRCVAGCPLVWVCLVSSHGQLGLMCSGETYPEAKWPSHCLMPHAHMWAPSYLTVCDPTGCSPRLIYPWRFPGNSPGVSCHFLLQGSSQLRDQTRVSCVSGSGRQILHRWATWEGLISYLVHVSNTTEEQWGSPRLQGILVCPSALRSLFFPFLVLLFPFRFGFFLLSFLLFESDSLLEDAVSTYFLRILI